MLPVTSYCSTWRLKGNGYVSAAVYIYFYRCSDDLHFPDEERRAFIESSTVTDSTVWYTYGRKQYKVHFQLSYNICRERKANQNYVMLIVLNNLVLRCFNPKPIGLRPHSLHPSNWPPPTPSQPTIPFPTPLHWLWFYLAFLHFNNNTNLPQPRSASS